MVTSIEKQNDVSEPCLGYKGMSVWWPLILDLLGGTERMREAGEKWLPRQENESIEQYQGRLKLSFLFAGFEEAINDITSRPFSEPVTINDLPEALAYLETDVDGAHTSFGSFTKQVFADLVTWGIAHVLPDHSVVQQAVTINDEIQQGARVVYSRISPVNLIGWREDGEGNLTQIRYRMNKVVPDGLYGDKCVETIRVWDAESIVDHVKNDKNEWVPSETMPHTFGSIPLVTININPTGFMTAKPPLLNMAWLNCRHWQSQSEQNRILGMSRFAILFGKGFTKGEVKDGIEVGPMKGIFSSGDNAEMKYVEHTGAAINSGRDDLKEIEHKMTLLGHRPYTERAGDTAVGKKVSEERNVSQVKAWIHATEDGMSQSLEFAARWRKIQQDTPATVDIYSDFEVSLYGSGDKEHLLELHREGVLAKEALLHEEKRRGIIGDKYTVDELITMLDNEAGKEVADELEVETDEEPDELSE